MKAEAKLNDRMVGLSDRCKRDIVAWNAQRKEKAISEVDFAGLQVIVGMAIRQAVQMGRSFERWNVTQPLVVEDPRPPMPPRHATLEMCVPARVDDSPQAWDDKTTEKMPPRKQWP